LKRLKSVWGHLEKSRILGKMSPPQFSLPESFIFGTISHHGFQDNTDGRPFFLIRAIREIRG
jgi:hypothetical protein